MGGVGLGGDDHALDLEVAILGVEGGGAGKRGPEAGGGRVLDAKTDSGGVVRDDRLVVLVDEEQREGGNLAPTAGAVDPDAAKCAVQVCDAMGHSCEVVPVDLSLVLQDPRRPFRL